MPDRSIHISINREITASSNGATIRNIVNKQLDQFNAINLSTALYRLAVLRYQGSELLMTLGNTIVARIDEFAGQAVNNCLWALAKLDWEKDENTFNALVQHAQACCSEYTPTDMSKIIWACATRNWQLDQQAMDISTIFCSLAKANIVDQESMQKLSEKFFLCPVNTVNPQTVSNILWAMAKLDYNDESLLTRLLQQAIQYCNTSQFKAQELSTVCWVLAKKNINNEELMTSLFRSISSQLGHFKSQSLVNLFWSMEVLQYRNSNLVHQLSYRLADELPKKYQNFNPQDTATSFITLIKLNLLDQKLCSTLMTHAKTLCDRFNHKDATDLLWGMAKREQQDKELLSQLKQIILYSVEQLSREQLGGVFWSLGTLNWDDHELIEALSKRIVEGGISLDFQGIVTAFSAIAKIKWKNKALISNLSKQLTNMAPSSYTCYGSYDLLWAFAVLGIKRKHLCPKLIEKIEQSNEPIDKKDLSKLLQWQFFWEQEKRKTSLINQTTIDTLEQAKAKLRKDQPSSSQLHRRVVEQFNNRGDYNDFEEEVFVSPCYYLDMAFPKRKIAIEINGPYHKLTSKYYSGTTYLKQRQLEHQQWRIINIDHVEWDKCSTNQQKQELLSQKLKSQYEPNGADKLSYLNRRANEYTRKRKRHSPSGDGKSSPTFSRFRR